MERFTGSFALMPYHGKNLETIPVNIQSLK